MHYVGIYYYIMIVFQNNGDILPLRFEPRHGEML
jgi:hypothetical protein